MDALLYPLGRILQVGIIDEFLGGQICRSQMVVSPIATNSRIVLTRIKVIREEVVVSLIDGIDEGLKDTSITESAGRNLIQHSGKSWRLLPDGYWVVAVAIAEAFDCGGEVTKED